MSPLDYLPKLTGFIRRNAMAEWCSVYRRNAEAAGLNLAAYFNAVDEDLDAVMSRRLGALMLSVEQQQFRKYIEDSISIMFPKDGESLEMIEQKAADVITLNYLRKKTLLHFAKPFSENVEIYAALVGEIDDFGFAFEKVIQQRYLEIIKSSLEKEKEINSRLQLREGQLLEAQRITSIGSFVWNITEMQAEVTPELMAILELDSPHDFHGFMDMVHPEDKPALEASLNAALNDKLPYDSTYRYLSSAGEKILRSRGIVSDVAGAKTMSGTVTDVTHQQELINRLEKSKALYKQAQQLGKIGNWSLNAATGIVEWSDEVFRIYGLVPEKNSLPIDTINTYFHPDDSLRVQRNLANVISGDDEDYTDYARIITPKGEVKNLEVKGNVSRSKDGSVSVFGTIQDITAERTLIDKLEFTTDLYRRMESIAHIGTWSFDIPANTVHWSEELHRIYGFTPSEEPVNYEAARMMTNEPHRSINAAHIAKCMEDGTPYDVMGSLSLPDGTRKIIRGKGEAVKDATGKVIRLFGTLQDITAQDTLAEQLRLSEASLKQAQSTARIGSGIFYVETGDSKWSDELYNIFEVDKGTALTYEKIASLLPQRDWELMELHIKRCVENGVRFDFQGRLLLREGRTKYVRIIGEPHIREAGITKEIFCTVQDVTELKVIEQRLRENQRYAQKINDVTPAVIAVLNVQTGEYKMVSKMAEALFGQKPEAIMAGGFEWMAAQLHPDDLATTIQQNAAAIQKANDDYPNYPDDKIIEFRYRIRHADGEYRYVQTSAIIFDRDDAGQVEHVLNVTIDITQMMQAEQLLQQKNHQLEQSNANLQEFAYIASHDLQEPLRKISTFGTMLEGLDTSGLPERGQMFLRKIIESSVRMQGMINDILSVSIISGSKGFETVSLQQIFEEAIVPLDHKIEQMSACVTVPEDLPEATIIPGQFRQLFQNLVGNALKFARPDEPPVIQVSHQYITAAEAIAAGLDGNTARYLSIQIADNGIGFSNDYASRIFAIFQRLNGKSEYEGSGIGLAICKKIVEHHGGVISASGKVGQGAVFTIVLPAQ